MRRSGFTRNEILLLLASFGALIFILVPRDFFDRSKRNAKRAICQSNLKQIGLALKQYSIDYDGNFPLTAFRNAASTPFGWADAISPYLGSNDVFQCPSEANGGHDNPQEINYTDYWLNAHLSGQNLTRLEATRNTILTGEGNDGTDVTNARYSKSTLPPQWIANKNSPANRHVEGANYAFADGHVKWLKPKSIFSTQSDGKSYIFAVK